MEDLRTGPIRAGWRHLPLLTPMAVFADSASVTALLGALCFGALLGIWALLVGLSNRYEMQDMSLVDITAHTMLAAFVLGAIIMVMLATLFLVTY